MILSNRIVTGAEAAQWGLVSRAVPAPALTAESESLIRSLADGPVKALARAKALASEARGLGLVEAMEREAAEITAMVGHP